MAENDNFVIVEFSDGLSIVPSTWFHEDRRICWWPGHLKSQLLVNRAIINRTRPEERTWVEYTVHKIFGTADSYVKAMDKLIQAEDTSHINDSKSMNDTENIEKAKKRRRFRAHKNFDNSFTSDDGKYTDDANSTDENDGGKMNRQRKPERKKGKIINKCSKNLVSPPFISGLQQNNSNEHSIETSTPILKNKNNPEASGSCLQQTNSNMQHFIPTPLTSFIKNKNNPQSSSSSTMHKKEQYLTPLEEINDELSYKTNPGERKDNDEFQLFVISKLTEISHKLTSMGKTMKKLEEKIGRNENVLENIEGEEIELPLNSQGEIEQFEIKLKKKDFVHQMISTLRKVGGNEIHVVIPRILNKLWTDSLAELFSYDGKKNKESFKRLETEKLIKKVAHLMCGPTCTDAQIKECASKWLAQAKVRRTRREARLARVNANIAEEDSDN